MIVPRVEAILSKNNEVIIFYIKKNVYRYFLWELQDIAIRMIYTTCNRKKTFAKVLSRKL